MIDVWRSGAVQSMTVYVASLERAADLLAQAESMPFRRIFGDGLRADRTRVIHQAVQALDDAHNAANHVQDLDAVIFGINAQPALIQAKLARGALQDVPSYAALRTSIQDEVARVQDTANVVAGLGAHATPGQRAALLANVRNGAHGDARARERLVQALVAASSTNDAIRKGASAEFGAYEGAARALVERLVASPDEATILRQVGAAASGWSADVFASPLEHVATSAADARILLRSVRSELAGLRAADPFVGQLRAATVELIEQNEQRLATNVGTGSGRGYQDHPDYADLGRIQANVRLLRSLDALELAPVPAAPTAPEAQAAATTGGETLVW
jgi:hypothetical protein